jgi:hypothetical protein
MKTFNSCFASVAKNKPWAAFYVACFPTLSMGFWLSMLFNRWQAGWSPVLFRVMQA